MTSPTPSTLADHELLLSHWRNRPQRANVSLPLSDLQACDETRIKIYSIAIRQLSLEFHQISPKNSYSVRMQRA